MTTLLKNSSRSSSPRHTAHRTSNTAAPCLYVPRTLLRGVKRRHARMVGFCRNQALTSSGSSVKIPGFEASLLTRSGGLTPSIQNSSTEFLTHGGGRGLPTTNVNRLSLLHQPACVSSAPSPVHPPSGFSQLLAVLASRFRPFPYSRSPNRAGFNPSANSRRRPLGSGLSSCQRSSAWPNSLKPWANTARPRSYCPVARRKSVS